MHSFRNLWNSSIWPLACGPVDLWIDLPFKSQLFDYLLKQSIFELCTIVWQDFSAVYKCKGDMSEAFVHNFLCCFSLWRDAEHITCQHTYNSEDVFMSTGGFWESTHQIHWDKFHGHGPRSEIVLDVSSLFHLLFGTYLAVLTMHEYIFLHSFPVVQPPWKLQRFSWTHCDLSGHVLRAGLCWPNYWGVLLVQNLVNCPKSFTLVGHLLDLWSNHCLLVVLSQS